MYSKYKEAKSAQALKSLEASNNDSTVYRHMADTSQCHTKVRAHFHTSIPAGITHTIIMDCGTTCMYMYM